jgi:hypothetical protein
MLAKTITLDISFSVFHSYHQIYNNFKNDKEYSDCRTAKYKSSHDHRNSDLIG